MGSDGKVSTGDITATDRGEALRVLGKKGLQPIRVKESLATAPAAKSKSSKATKPQPKAKQASPARKKPSSDEDEIPEGPIKLKRGVIVTFTEELSEMLAAGLQLEPALKAMENREELGDLKQVAIKIRQLVRDGASFSSALNKVSPSFGPLYCNLAAAGEASGALPSILEAQANYLRSLQELQGRVAVALIYPILLVAAGIGVSVIFVTKLIPQLLSLVDTTGGKELSLGIRLLVGANEFIQNYGLFLLIGFIAACLLFKAWKDKPDNKPLWDAKKIHLPGYGKVVEKRFQVQFLETMANLVGNGLPLLRSLELTRDATVNLFYKEHLGKVIDEVGDGRSFSRAMVRSDMFPPVMIDMVSVGEQTGKLDQALRRASVRYNKELDIALQKLMALIMPVVLIAMAILIGGMMYLMVNSIFDTINDVQRR